MLLYTLYIHILSVSWLPGWLISLCRQLYNDNKSLEVLKEEVIAQSRRPSPDAVESSSRWKKVNRLGGMIGVSYNTGDLRDVAGGVMCPVDWVKRYQ